MVVVLPPNVKAYHYFAIRKSTKCNVWASYLVRLRKFIQTLYLLPIFSQDPLGYQMQLEATVDVRVRQLFEPSDTKNKVSGGATWRISHKELSLSWNYSYLWKAVWTDTISGKKFWQHIIRDFNRKINYIGSRNSGMSSEYRNG